MPRLLNFLSASRNQMKEFDGDMSTDIIPLQLKTKLAPLHEQLSQSLSGVEHLQEEYRKEIDSYFHRNQPFSKNDYKMNCRDYEALVRYSLIIGNSSLIHEWGIEYPSQDFKRILQYPLSRYVKTFENICHAAHQGNAPGIPPEVEPYYQYLIDRLQVFL